MNEKQIEEAKKRMCTKRNGNLRKMFYKRNGLPKQGLLTKRQVLVNLNVDEFNPNSLELGALTGILGVALAYLRKQAKDAGLAWIDVETTMSGRKVARHGFMQDLDLILSNADKFDEIADGRKKLAKQTRDIAKQQERLLPDDPKKLSS